MRVAEFLARYSITIKVQPLEPGNSVCLEHSDPGIQVNFLGGTRSQFLDLARASGGAPEDAYANLIARMHGSGKLILVYPGDSERVPIDVPTELEK